MSKTMGEAARRGGSRERSDNRVRFSGRGHRSVQRINLSPREIAMTDRRRPALKLTRLGVAAAFGIISTVVAAQPAAADSQHGCAYPRVCLYDGRYQDGGSYYGARDYGFQYLPESGKNRADAAVNTRNDDSVWLIDTERSSKYDYFLCLPANKAQNLGDIYVTGAGSDTWANDVTAIHIWNDDGRCAGSAADVYQGTVAKGRA
jgi:hypothetical protein